MFIIGHLKASNLFIIVYRTDLSQDVQMFIKVHLKASNLFIIAYRTDLPQDDK